MKNKLLGVSAVAAVTGLVGGVSASAAVEPVRMQAQSFAELLQPIPNATEQLKIADMQVAREEPRLIEAQYYDNNNNYNNHHHHHHHHHNRRWYLRNGYYWYGGAWVLRPRNHHHHHHHHHNNYPNNPPPPRPY